MAIQKRVPTDESVTYLEFSLSDPAYPFVAASQDGGRVLLQEIIPRERGEYGEFYSVMGVSPEETLALADEHGSVDAEVLARYQNGGLFEFVVGENCPAVFLGEHGALPRQVDSVDGEGRISAEVPTSVDASTVISRFRDAHPDAELTSKHQQPYTTPMFSHRELQSGLQDQLTDRQREVLTAAHEAGYYTWPRETTGEELADELDITSPTLHEHLRAAEQKLIAMVFDSAVVQSPHGSENVPN